jgi:hypothetical protein
MARDPPSWSAGRAGFSRADPPQGRSRVRRLADPHHAAGRGRAVLHGHRRAYPVNPLRGPGDATVAGQALFKAMGALEEATKDIHRHRAIGELMGMTD